MLQFVVHFSPISDYEMLRCVVCGFYGSTHETIAIPLYNILGIVVFADTPDNFVDDILFIAKVRTVIKC